MQNQREARNSVKFGLDNAERQVKTSAKLVIELNPALKEDG